MIHKPTMEPKEKFVPKSLRKAAEIYEERNALYGDVYKRFGHVMIALFEDGVYEKPEDGHPVDQINRYGLLIQIVGKLMRYCYNFSKGGHADSLDDLAVYAIMLKELDEEAQCDVFMSGASDEPASAPHHLDLG